MINKTLPLSISMPPLIIFFLSMPKCWVLSLPHAKKKYWWLIDQRSRRRRRRLLIKELIQQSRSKKLIKVFKVEVLLWKKNLLRRERSSRSISMDICKGWTCVWLNLLRIWDHQKRWISTRIKIMRSDLLSIFKF